MADLIEKGLLFCNPLKYFTEVEDEKMRGTDLENAVQLIYMESGEAILGNPEEDPIKVILPL